LIALIYVVGESCCMIDDVLLHNNK
jgi:hypothetical protein